MSSKAPGVFVRNGEQLYALSNLHRMTGIPSPVIVDAILKDKLKVEEVSGCQVVSKSSLQRFLDGREGGK